MRKLFAALLCLTLLPIPGAAKDVTVKNFSPQGEISSARPKITAVFSGPVVGKSQVGKVLKDGAVPLRFRPALPGSAKWTAPDTLVFTPSEDLLPATRYDADFGPGGLKTAQGQLVAGAQSFSFHRPPLSFEGMTPLNISPSRSVTLRLDFSEEIPPARLRGFLSLYDSRGKAVRYTVQGELPAGQIVVVTESVYGKTLRAVVSSGLLPEKGDLALASEKELTLVLSPVTTITESSASMSEGGRGVIRLGTNCRVDLAKAKGFIEISPEIPFNLSSNYDGFSITGDFEPRSRVTLTVRKGFSGNDAEPMAEDFTKSFIFPDIPSSIRFPAAGMFLTPAESPRVAVETSNIETLQLSAWKLYGNNIAVAALELNGWRDEFKRWAKPLGTKKFRVSGMANEITRRAADLASLGCEGTGIYLIEAKNADPDGWENATMLLCVTDAALSARLYKHGLQVWAATISGAKPLADADVKVYSASNQLLLSGKTDRSGTASFSVPDGWEKDLQPSLVTAEKDGEITFVRLGTNQLSGRDIDVSGAAWADAYEGLWIMPRSLWQPGETLEAQAIVRSAALELPGEFPLRWTFSNRGIELASGTLMLDGNGSGKISIPIPAEAESGSYSLGLFVPGTSLPVAERSVQVEEFRPPQIETSLKTPDALFPGTEAAFDISACYLFGGSGAGLQWSLSYRTEPEAYVSRSHPGYVFGCETFKDSGRSSGTINSGELDENGHAKAVWTPEADLKAPSIIRAHLRLNVMEANGRWTGSTVSLPLYPSRALIGVLKPNAEIRPNATAEIGLVAVDPSDKPLDLGNLRVEICRVNSRYVLVNDGNGSRMTWQEELSEPEIDSVSLNGLGKYIFKPKDEGEYLITFVHDDGRASVRLSVWESRRAASSAATMPDRVRMTSEKESYAVGSSAKISVKSPFAGRAFLAVGGDRPISIRSFDVTDSEMTLEIPITAEMHPNGWAVIQVVRPEGADTKPPYRALGALPLKLDLSAKKLDVKIDAPEKCEPGNFSAKIFVNDAAGKPAEGVVSIALVDRGILLLGGGGNENPFDRFTRRRALDGKLCDIYDSLLPIEARGTALLHPAGGDDVAMARTKLMANGDMMSPVRASDYHPLSIWKTDVELKNGVAEVRAQIPEFSGALSVEAVAISGAASGRAQAETKISRPVVIDLTLPRFASPGDSLRPALNLTAETDGQADVTITASESLELDSDGRNQAKISVDLKGGERLDLSSQIPDLLVSAGSHGSLNVEVSMNGRNFSAQTGLAVRPGWPRVTMTGGESVEGECEISLPDSWYPGTAEISLTLAGAPVTDALALLEAVNSWGCSLDRLISRGWTALCLPSLLGDDGKDLTNANENRIEMNTILAGLSSHQLYDGSWSAWRGAGTDAWGSVAAMHLLTTIEKTGASVSGLSAGRAWLRRFMAEPLPEEDAASVMDARAYGSYVLALADEAPLGWMNWLRERIESLSASGRALLAGSFALAGEREIARSLLGAESADGSEIFLPGAGFRLLAFDALAPGGADARNLAAKIAAAVVENSSTLRARDAGTILMALSVFNSHTVNGTASAKLFDSDGEEILSFDGTPAVWNGKHGGTMKLVPHGKGSVWYSWTASGVPEDEPESFSRGVDVEQIFIDAKTESPADLNDVEFGSEILMKIRVKKTTGCSALRLCAMLPAGFEAETGELTGGEDVSVRADLRFDRLILDVEGEGSEFEWQVPCRAVTRGRFTVPPVSAESRENSGVGFLGDPETLTIR